MKRDAFAIAGIYVRSNGAAALIKSALTKFAASMLDKGQQAPVLVRAGSFVLVKGLHRLEAAKTTRGDTKARRFPSALAETAKSARKLLHHLS